MIDYHRKVVRWQRPVVPQMQAHKNHPLRSAWMMPLPGRRGLPKATGLCQKNQQCTLWSSTWIRERPRRGKARPSSWTTERMKKIARRCALRLTQVHRLLKRSKTIGPHICRTVHGARIASKDAAPASSTAPGLLEECLSFHATI